MGKMYCLLFISPRLQLFTWKCCVGALTDEGLHLKILLPLHLNAIFLLVVTIAKQRASWPG